jgi:hypothetical protein
MSDLGLSVKKQWNSNFIMLAVIISFQHYQEEAYLRTRLHLQNRPEVHDRWEHSRSSLSKFVGIL